MAASEYGAISEAQVRIGISLDPPVQARASVFFRLILVIPLFFVDLGLSIAAFFVTIAAWFASLVTGRVPDGIQDFLTNVLRFRLNVVAYEYLLAGKWPGIPFKPSPTDQVSVEIDHVDLNRAAVFFRIILAIPALIVTQVLQYGVGLFLFVMWFWGFIAGREPRALHQGVALTVRYQFRLVAYVSLLTPTQPFSGLLGDDVVDEQASPAEKAPLFAPQPGRWIIIRAARVVVIVAIVLGAIGFVTQRAFLGSHTNNTTNTGALIHSSGASSH